MTHPSLHSAFDILDNLILELTEGYNTMPKKNRRIAELVDEGLNLIGEARQHVVQERAEILAALGVSGATVKTAYDKGYRLEAISRLPRPTKMLDT